MTGNARASDGDHETVYMLQDGALVPTYECVVSATAYACSVDGVEEFRTLSDPGWLEYPLPKGDLVYAVPHGWWAVQGDQAIPVDDIAAGYADGPVPMDEFIEIATDGGAPWPPTLLGFGWEFVWAAVAVVGLAVGGLVLWRRAPRTA